MDRLTESVMQASRLADEHARGHCCSRHCPDSDYAFGQVPDGWQAQLKALAARYGYGFERSYKPVQVNGPSCNGMTTGPVTTYGQIMEARRVGIAGHTVYYRPEHTEAQEFSVAAHEVAHALLGHPDMRAESSDSFESEMPVRLASIAVCEQAGLTTGQGAICQLVMRMQGNGKSIRADHQVDAIASARIIGQALNSKSYALA